MSRDLTAAAAIWAIVTVMAVAATFFLLDPFPTVGAEEAKVVDRAFMALTYMAAPVFGLVVAGLAYSMWRFRSRGEPAEDGPPLHGRGMVPVVWLVATSALAVVVMIYPGLTGLFELRSDQQADLVVDVTGFRWAWSISYPESGVRVVSPADELVLPARRRIEFNVTAPAGDVLHSFWIPAFRLKADAVPGATSTLYLTPDRVGTSDDVAYRLQCAELCGLGHTNMAMRVRVLEPDEFDRWLASRSAAAAGATQP